MKKPTTYQLATLAVQLLSTGKAATVSDAVHMAYELYCRCWEYLDKAKHEHGFKI